MRDYSTLNQQEKALHRSLESVLNTFYNLSLSSITKVLFILGNKYKRILNGKEVK